MPAARKNQPLQKSAPCGLRIMGPQRRATAKGIIFNQICRNCHVNHTAESPKIIPMIRVQHLSPGLVLVFLALAIRLSCAATDSTGAGFQLAEAWSTVPALLARIVPPMFPSREFDVTEFGAVAGGITNCTQAFSRAIAACAGAGGGRVYRAAGRQIPDRPHSSAEQCGIASFPGFRSGVQ